MPANDAHPEREAQPGQARRIGAREYLDLVLGEAGGSYLVTFTGSHQGQDKNGKPKLVGIDQRSWVADNGWEAAVEYCAKQSEAGRDVYVGVHLYREAGGRRKRNAAETVCALWCDTDGAQLPEHYPQPNLRVESSPGREHLYWLLEEQVPAEEAAALNRRIAYGMGADVGKWGLGTVLRVPETSNYKREEPTPVTAQLVSDTLYDPEALNAALPAAEDVVPAASSAGKRERREPPERTDAAPGEPPVRLLPADREAWDGTRSVSADGGGVDRSRTLHWIGCGVARGLRRAGVAEHEHCRIIEDAVEERDRTLGYDKYTGRDDRLERYAELASEAVAEAGREPARNGSGGAYGSSGPTGGSSFGSGGVAPTPRAYRHTDYGNAERLVDRHGHDLHYLYAWQKWLVWDGRRWAIDTTGEVERRAKETVRSIYAEAANAADDEMRKAIAKHAQLSESRGSTTAMIAHARSEPDIPVEVLDLDTDPYLLNALNGIIDLRTGDLRAHDRSNLITKLAPVEYDPQAQAPVWEAFLGEILPSEEVRGYLQRLIGYALTGKISEHILPICHGVGANGKSTLLNTVLEMMGDYGLQAAGDLLIVKKEAHPTEQADLFGRRLVTNMETEDGRRFAESRVKQLTGGDRVRARRMREDFWEFLPTHTLFLATNHKPEVRGTDHAIWRRLRLIPFEVAIPEPEQDKLLDDKLRAELPGILRWAVEGCLAWQRDGLGEPAEVMAATAGYREEMDPLGSWLAECCVEAPGAWAKLADLYRSYADWCEDAHEHALTKRSFSQRLTERGHEAAKGKGNVAIRRGIGLSSSNEYTSSEGEAPKGAERVTQEPSSSNPENPCTGQENEERVTQGYPESGLNGGKFSREGGIGNQSKLSNPSNPEADVEVDKTASEAGVGPAEEPHTEHPGSGSSGDRLGPLRDEAEVQHLQRLRREGYSTAEARAQVVAAREE